MDGKAQQNVGRWGRRGPAVGPGTHSMPKLLWDMMLKAKSSVVVVFSVVQMRLPVLRRQG